MTPGLRARAKRERAARLANDALVGFFRSLTLPVRHPMLWLQSRYYWAFFTLYWAGFDDAAFRFARIWPQGLVMVTDYLQARAKGEGWPL
jgi:hypothetical protein